MTQLRTLLLMGAALLPCLLFTRCVIGGEGNPCKTTAECAGSQVCFSGVCLNPQSETIRKEEQGRPSDDRREPPALDGSEPDPPPERRPTETIPDGPPPDDARPDQRPTDRTTPEDVPEPINYGPQRRIGLTSGGGAMSSSSYRLYGSVSAGLLGHPQKMSSPNYQLNAGIIAGTQP